MKITSAASLRRISLHYCTFLWLPAHIYKIKPKNRQQRRSSEKELHISLAFRDRARCFSSESPSTIYIYIYEVVQQRICVGFSRLLCVMWCFSSFGRKRWDKLWRRSSGVCVCVVFALRRDSLLLWQTMLGIWISELMLRAQSGTTENFYFTFHKVLVDRAVGQYGRRGGGAVVVFLLGPFVAGILIKRDSRSAASVYRKRNLTLELERDTDSYC